MNCDHCYEFKEKHSIKPRCETPLGCPIEDLAGDVQVTEFCAQYDLAKHLFEASQMPRAQERIFEELGLFDDPILWLRMESTFARAKQRKQQRANNDTKRKGRA